jgi:putative membrane protein
MSVARPSVLFVALYPVVTLRDLRPAGRESDGRISYARIRVTVSEGGLHVMPYMNGYWFGFGGLLMLLFWVFVIAGIVWAVLTLSRQQHARGGESGALRILEERLARGEIDTEEFRTRRAAIEETKR